jgi:hypothetical protein
VGKFVLCYLSAMSTKTESAIRRLVDHHGGPTKVAALLGDGFAYQLVQQWLQREWASPMHILKLEPLMPPGMTIRDLFADREAAKAAV